MSGFVKLDTGMLNSSLWIERDSRSVFVTALLMAEPYELREPLPQIEVRTLKHTGWVVPPGWYGLVPAAGSGIIRRDGMEDLEEGYAILEKLCSPDPESRSQDFEGRRLARIDGGYLVLNYFTYRDRDYTAAERMRRYRKRKKKPSKPKRVTRNSAEVTRNVTQAEAEDRSRSIDTTPPPRARAKAKQPTGEQMSYGSSVNATASVIPKDYRDDYYALVSRLPLASHSSWAAEVKALLEGMHGPVVEPQVMGRAIRDYNAAFPAQPSLRHFRAFVASFGKDGNSDSPKQKSEGTTLRSGEIIKLIRSYRNPQFPNAALPEWRDKLSQAEVRAVNAIGVDRILNDKQEGIVLAQLAKTLGEAGA